MILCFIKTEKLIKFRHNRHTMNPTNVVEMLKDPDFRKMVEFRMKMNQLEKELNDL